MIQEYIDSIVTTKCLSNKFSKRSTFHKTALICECKNKHNMKISYASNQVLRNMQFQLCPKYQKQQSIATCDTCNKHLTLQTLINNAQDCIFKKFTNNNKAINKKEIIECILGINNVQQKSIPFSTNFITKEEYNFLLQTQRNMHKQDHSFTCFKKGNKC